MNHLWSCDVKRSQAPLLTLFALLTFVGVMLVFRSETESVAPAASLPSTTFDLPDSREGDASGPAAMIDDGKGVVRIGGHATMSATSLPVPLSQQLAARELSPEQRQARELGVLDEILSDPGSFADLPEAERDRLVLYAGQLALADTPFTRCWSPGTPRELVQAYLQVEQRISAAGGFNSMALQGIDRWTRTATNGTGQGTQGQPVTLTWSIVPDGTPITGDANETSSLRARMAAIYGGSATGDPTAQPWFAVYQATFDNLAAISGLRFVYEPADDGTTISGGSLLGALGLRGDIRISGHPIDGNNGTLAYAYFPDIGDVVIDTDDTYFNTISNNSIRLHNILEHEIGHSLGLDHVCPVNATKLMEPFINTNFRGSQFDDIYSHQRNYGDPLEVHGSILNNDNAANATPLALVTGATASWEWLSIDDSTDSDLFSFSGTRDHQVSVRIIPSDPVLPSDPVNDTYLEGSQTTYPNCDGGTPFDPTTQQDLILDLLGTNGTTVVASAPSQAAGVTEEIVTFRLPSDGTHYIRVRGGTADRAQLYRMEVLRVDAPPTPRIAITATRLDAESNSGTNGVPDPGETVRYGLTLTNEGNLTASGLVATLSAPPGSTVFAPAANYGTLAPGASDERQFTFAVGGAPGDTVNLQLSLAAPGYAEVLSLPLTLGTTTTAVLLDENFDGSSILPAGWSQSVSGAGSTWVISTNRSSSAPNSAFSPSVSPNGEALLVSPAITVGPDGGGVLEFSHRYLLESLRDGGVLEASRNGGAWFDLMNSAATVEAGDYNGNIANNSSSSIKGRQAWTSSTAAFVTSRVRLPAAWAGESIVFRWRLVHNSATTVTGWNVDDVKFSSTVKTADPFRPFLSLATSGSQLSEQTPGAGVTLTLSTPLPLATDVTVVLERSGSAGASDFSAPLTLLLPAGQTSSNLEIFAAADGLAEGPETAMLSIPAGQAGYAPADPASLSLAIEDTPVQPASITLSNLVVTYDGFAKPVIAITDPAGIGVSVTYDGSPVVPSNAGSYAVSATVTSPGYSGSASGTLVIRSAYTAWISTFTDPADPDAAASRDLDGDGWDNAGEYAFGTLPNNPSSLPQLQPVLTATTMMLMVPNPPAGIVLSAETSTGLDNWTTGGVATIPGGFEVARNGPKRFLRIVYEVVN